jgi:hypothetical protein
VTVVTNARVYYTPRAAAGAPGARHSLRPLFSESGKFKAKLAHIGGEIAKLCLQVTSLRGALQRSNPALQFAAPMDCFACARNDEQSKVDWGSACLKIESEISASMSRANRNAPQPSSPAKAGDPVFQRRW